jgi:hypothetical protein
MYDEKPDMVTDERLAAFEPHDEKGSLRVESEAGKATAEGAPSKMALRDRRSRSHMNAMRVYVAPVFGVEQGELPAA